MQHSSSIQAHSSQLYITNRAATPAAGEGAGLFVRLLRPPWLDLSSQAGASLVGGWEGYWGHFAAWFLIPKTYLLRPPEAAVCSSNRLHPPALATSPRLSPLIRLFEVALDTLPFPALVIRRSNPHLPKRTHASRLFPPKRKTFSVTVEE